VFNHKQFEDKVYSLVTREINKTFLTILKSDVGSVQTEGIKLHKRVMETLHYIAEEVATQILYGLLANSEARRKKY
jgi:hypothetical protein